MHALHRRGHSPSFLVCEACWCVCRSCGARWRTGIDGYALSGAERGGGLGPALADMLVYSVRGVRCASCRTPRSYSSRHVYHTCATAISLRTEPATRRTIPGLMPHDSCPRARARTHTHTHARQHTARAATLTPHAQLRKSLSVPARPATWLHNLAPDYIGTSGVSLRV